MSKELVYRTSVDLHSEGRTLLGIALPWDKPARVSDDFGRSFYREAFAPGCADVSIAQGGPRPLFVSHGHREGRGPIGAVGFTRSAEGLLFEAKVSKTRDGDEALELVNDGAMRSVSVGALPIAPPTPKGGWALRAKDVVRRTAINLKELSLAPTGWGQVPEARVLSVRALDAISVLRAAVDDPDDNPGEIAAAIDAVTDAQAAALAAGDIATAMALNTALDMASDRLLALFGVADPDDPDMMTEGDRALTPARDDLKRRLAAMPT